MKTTSTLAFSLLLPISLGGCVGSSMSDDSGGDDDLGDGKADGISDGTYFECTGLATTNAVWLDLGKTSLVATVEDVGANTGKVTTSDATTKTFSNWTTKAFFGPGDTLVVPNSLLTSGSGKVTWNIANVNPQWVGTCTKKTPSGNQCLPLLKQIYPVDSKAKATYTNVSSGHYTEEIPSTSVGAFSYDIDVHVSGILCTTGAVTSVSCSAIVAEKIGEQASDDGSSSGQPYVSKRTKTSTGYSWAGGVHDAESGEFAYTLTTDSDEDGCSITGITTVE